MCVCMRRFVLFSREARSAIPESIIEGIKARNAADIELHKHATLLLQQQRAKHVSTGTSKLAWACESMCVVASACHVCTCAWVGGLGLGMRVCPCTCCCPSSLPLSCALHVLLSIITAPLMRSPHVAVHHHCPSHALSTCCCPSSLPLSCALHMSMPCPLSASSPWLMLTLCKWPVHLQAGACILM